MKLYPILPVIFIGTYLFVGTSIAVNTPKAAWVSLVVFSIFFALYFVFKRFGRNNYNGAADM
jgi:APA family basic amino acid/polyamine antiporter